MRKRYGWWRWNLEVQFISKINSSKYYSITRILRLAELEMGKFGFSTGVGFTGNHLWQNKILKHLLSVPLPSLVIRPKAKTPQARAETAKDFQTGSDREAHSSSQPLSPCSLRPRHQSPATPTPWAQPLEARPRACRSPHAPAGSELMRPWSVGGEGALRRGRVKGGPVSWGEGRGV